MSDFSKQIKLDIEHLNLTGVFSVFNDGVIITDHEGIIVFYNDTQVKIDELEQADVIGKSMHKVYHVTYLESPTLRCLQDKRPIISHVSQYRTIRGKEVNASQSSYPLFENDVLIGSINFIREYGRMSKHVKQTLKKKSKQNYRKGPGITFQDIIGKNPLFLQSVQTAMKAAGSISPVMLCGESGTGKEFFAQSIHNLGKWQKRNFTAINCSAIPENLLEGILFGTSQGAFTGAIEKPGLFEEANGGTIFLDELNSMPIGLQAKLLRVIQEKKVRRVGSLDESEINLKIICSINEDPEKAIKGNRLRRDIFYRLAVVLIKIPPLRDRLDDLAILIPHFINQCNKKLKKNVKAVSDEVENLFLNHNWPGNIRELEHVIEGTMNMVFTESIISKSLLPEHFTRHFDQESAQNILIHNKFKQGSTTINTMDHATSNSIKPFSVKIEGRCFKDTIAEVETHIICEMIRQFNGNAAKAAKELGMSRQLIYLKMKKLGIRSYNKQN